MIINFAGIFDHSSILYPQVDIRLKASTVLILAKSLILKYLFNLAQSIRSTSNLINLPKTQIYSHLYYLPDHLLHFFFELFPWSLLFDLPITDYLQETYSIWFWGTDTLGGALFRKEGTACFLSEDWSGGGRLTSSLLEFGMMLNVVDSWLIFKRILLIFKFRI